MPASIDRRPGRLHDRPGRRLLGNRWLVGVVVLFLAAQAPAEQRTLEVLRLVPGIPIERPLAAAGADLFDFDLEAGRHWRVGVEQVGIDVVVEVKNPQGQSLLTIDNPLGREGMESFLLTPTVGGLHRIEVRSEEPDAPSGHYEIQFDELPSTTPGDQLRLTAERAMTEAARFYSSAAEGSSKLVLSKLHEALDSWQGLGDQQQEARTWFFLGKVSDQLEDRRGAVVSYGRALELWRQLQDLHRVAAVLDRLGLAHQDLGENPRAIHDLEEALLLRQRLGQRRHEAETRNYLCLALQKSGRFGSASGCYQETLLLAQELDDTALVATVLNNLGGIYRNLGEPAAALDFFQQALSLRRALRDELAEANTLNNLGALHRGLGEIEEALLYYDPALAIFERLGNRTSQARTLNNIGSAYLSLGELQRARAYLLRALALRREVDDKRGEAVTLRNLGWAHSRLEEPGKALAYYRKALENDLASGNPRGVATTRKLLGEFQVTRGQPQEALVELELALASQRQMGNRQEEADVLKLLSRVRLDLGESRQARTLATQALALYGAIRSPMGEVSTRAALARIEGQLGQHQAAREHLEAALSALETLQGRLGDTNQRASFLATQREVYELYVGFLMDLHRADPSAGHHVAALEASERARSRSLLTLLEQVGAGLELGVRPELAARLPAAEHRLAAKTRHQLRVLGRVHTGEEALAADQEFYAALTELENVRAEIRSSSPRYASLTQPQTLDAAALGALLDDNTVLLEFFLGEVQSFLWWVTHSSVLIYELPPRADIERLAAEVHQQLSSIEQRSAEHRQALAALGQMLLGPISDLLRAQRLVVVADGALHAIPFAALPLPGTHEPVLMHHEVVNLPSASVLASQRREIKSAARKTARKTAKKTVAIFADPIFDRRDPRLLQDVAKKTDEGHSSPAPSRAAPLLHLQTLGRLPHTGREAEAIAALVPAEDRLLAMGGAARRQRVVEDDLRAYRILHFATHGLINPRTPELSGLMLSRYDPNGGPLDGFLGLYDVSNLELSAELVVLSGCHTALGKEVRGEGLVGLTRGFMYAGVPRVVASLWQVRDQATADLMTRFYHAMLVQNLPPAAALRAAQLALRQERRFRDPFYWAAFTLQGDWR